MGNVIGGILGAIGSVIGAVVNAVASLVGTIYNAALKYVIEPVMNFLGFKDEDIYKVAVSSTKVYNEDQYEPTRTRLAISKMKNNTSSRDFALGFADVGEAQFSKYYYSGKYDYTDHLPTSQFIAVTIPTSAIIEALESKGQINKVIDVLVGVPSDEDWCKYQMRLLYGYDIGDDWLNYQGTSLVWDYCYFNTTTGNFKAVLKTPSEFKKVIFHTTTITVTPIEEEVEITNPDGSITTEIVINNDKVHTIIRKEVIYYRTDNGKEYRREAENILDTTTIVPHDSVKADIIVEFISEEVIKEQSKSFTFTLPHHNNKRYYIVKYLSATNNIEYWLYDPTTNKYPNISEPFSATEDFEMYPIVLLREDYGDIVDYDKYSHPNLTEERYEATVDILSKIGVSLEDITKAYKENPSQQYIQDAFFFLGVSPSENDPIVSKVLYEIFNFAYDVFPYTSDSKSYAAVFKEEPYNASISWVPKEPTTTYEVIGSIGDCTHNVRNVNINTNVYKVTEITSIPDKPSFKEVREYTITEKVDDTGYVLETTTSDVTITIKQNINNSYPDGTTKKLVSSSSEVAGTLTVKKQIDAKRTTELTMYHFTNFVIIRHPGGCTGVSLYLVDPNMVIPIPKDVIGRLTLIEKTKLLDNAVYMQFYSVQHIHLEWYETSAFANFLKIISIGITVVVSIVSFGSMTAQTITLTTALLGALKAVTIAIALHLSLQIISSTIDITWLKAALSIAAMVAAMYIGGAFDNFNLSTAVKLAEIPSKASDIFMNSNINELQESINDFNKRYTDILNQYEDIHKELDSGLTVEDIVSVNLSAPNDITLSTPSSFIYNAISACTNFDSLLNVFDNTVSNFINSKLMLSYQGE